jgi:DNA polymerase-3 subunit alpha
MDKVLPELYTRIISRGHSEDVANWCIESIKPFVGYGFNKSHAAAYSYITYQTAYLKANYPIEYMAALLQVFYTNEEKVVKYVKVARDMGIEVLPPDINKSEVGFTIDGENNAIRFGLGSIKGLGEATLDAILEERKVRQVPVVRDEDGGLIYLTQEEAETLEEEDKEAVIGLETVGGPFTSAVDVVSRIPKKNFNRKTVYALCFAGAFDELASGNFNNRFEYLAHMLDVRGEVPDAELIESITKYTDRIKFEKEREVLGLYVSGHVLARLAEPTDWDNLDDAMHFTMVSLTEARVIRTKKGDNMAFLRVDTLEGERSLTLFPSHYETVKEGLVPGMLMKVGVKGQMNWQRNQKDFIINSITIPKKINKDIWKRIEKDNTQEEGAA